MALDARERRTLLEVAQAAIVAELERRPLFVDPSAYPPSLQAPGAAFVTLHVKDSLHGCIGSLEAYRALAADVADNARAAAFRDPRFPALTMADLSALRIHISILGPAETIRFASEDDLLRQLRPGVDGVVLREGGHRGTFLPDVWRVLPEPRDFLRHLKQKAGLPPDYWSDTIEVSRYTTESID